MPVLRLASLFVVAGLSATGVLEAAGEPLLRMPSMPEWSLLHKVEPQYPALAVQRHIQGTVRFRAVIGVDGHIEQLRLIAGHPLLVPAAREAALQWIYCQSFVGGEPARVMTEIQIRFQLDPYGQPLNERGSRGSSPEPASSLLP